MSECVEMGKSLSDTMDQVTALEEFRDSMIKEHKKIHEKCMNLENRGQRQNHRFVCITEGAEAGNPTLFKNLGDSPVMIDCT